MTYWYNGPHDRKDVWYWVAIALAHAYGNGLYNTPESMDATVVQNHLHRRLWWCILLRDHQLALGMRRPPQMRITSNQIAMLTLDDFDCEPLPQMDILPADCIVVRDTFQRRQLALICIEQCKLCVCIGKILSARYTVSKTGSNVTPDACAMLVPKQDFELEPSNHSHERELERWLRNLPSVCKYDSFASLKGFESPIMIIQKAILRMFFLTAVAILHRPHILPFTPWSTTTSPFAAMITNLKADHKTWISRAAGEVSAIARDLKSMDLIRYLPTSSITVFLPAMLTHIIAVRFGSEAAAGRSIRDYSEGAMILRVLTDNYASAELSLGFVEDTAHAADIRLVSPERPLIPSGSLIRRSQVACSPNTAITAAQQNGQDSDNGEPPETEIFGPRFPNMDENISPNQRSWEELARSETFTTGTASQNNTLVVASSTTSPLELLSTYRDSFGMSNPGFDPARPGKDTELASCRATPLSFFQRISGEVDGCDINNPNTTVNYDLALNLDFADMDSLFMEVH